MTYVIAAVIVIGVVGVASIYYLWSSQNPKNGTTTTCTVVDGTNGFYSFYCSTPVRITGTDGKWNFTVYISSDSVALGQSIQLSSSLTNTAGANQTVSNWVVPYVNPEIYATNGTQLWAWNPPQHTIPNMTFANGQVVTESVNIPTSGLRSGRDYFISLEPLSIQFHLNDGETPYTFQFTVK